MASSRSTKATASAPPATTAAGPVKARDRRSKRLGGQLSSQSQPPDPPKQFRTLVDQIAGQHRRPSPVSSQDILLVPYQTVASKITRDDVKHQIKWHFTAEATDKTLLTANTAFLTAVNQTAGLKVISQVSPVKDRMPSVFIGCDVDRSTEVMKTLEALRDGSNLGTFVTDERSRIWFTLRSKHAGWVVSVQVDAGDEAVFINEVSNALFNAGVPDPQIAVQKRSTADKNGFEFVQGVIIDADHNKPPDLLGTISAAGIPMPATRWETTNGYKLLYTFTRAVEPGDAELFAKWVTVAIPGGDPNSWLMSQFQHLPTCHKTKNDKTLEVVFPAVQSNATPIDLDTFPFEQLPPRIIRLGYGRQMAISDEERERVEEYLQQRGTPAPVAAGQHRYAQCPNDVRHSHDSGFAVFRSPDGTINAHCFGGHDDEMRCDWSERDLLLLADGDAIGVRDKRKDAVGLDVLRDISTTWVGIDFLRQLITNGFGEDGNAAGIVDAAIDLWYLAKAHLLKLQLFKLAIKKAEEEGAINLEVLQGPSVEEIVSFSKARLLPYLSRSSLRVYFDEVNLDMHYFDKTGGTFPINTKATTLGSKTAQFVHYWRASEGFRLAPRLEYKKTAKGVKITGESYAGENLNLYESHWNSAFLGDGEAIAALGFPKIVNNDFPLSFTDGDYRHDPETKCISQHRLPKIKEGNDNFDVVAFFERLFKKGRLPLATENDVRRMVMAVATPFLRYIAPGLLGVYWFLGPSGAGKDFLASVVCDIWLEGVVRKPLKSSFELREVDDNELQKVFFAAKDAPFARAKEAGKTQAKIMRLIQLAGTEHVTKRGHYKHEVQVPNVYTYLADSAEDLPDKKEISRRTVAINVEAVAESVSLGEVRAEILEHAPDILRGLKRLVEAHEPAWFLNQAKTDSRPVVPVALARILDVALEDVGGRDLTQVFEVMLEYQKEDGVEGLGHKEREKMARSGHKGSKLETAVPSYPYAHFVEIMSQDKKVDDGSKYGHREPRGYRMLLREFDTHRKLRRTLDTEMGYKQIGKKKKFLPVRVNGTPYAFRFVGSDSQNFILMPEEKLCDAVDGLEPITPGLREYIEKKTSIEREKREALEEIEAEEKQELSRVYGEMDDNDPNRETLQAEETQEKYTTKKDSVGAEYDRLIRELKVDPA